MGEQREDCIIAFINTFSVTEEKFEMELVALRNSLDPQNAFAFILF